MDETKIIQAVLGGDLAQYAPLVERYHIGLIIYCEQILKDRDEAEDAAQKGFIKAYQQLQNFDPELGRFSTWLYKIARNTCLDILRAQHHTVSLDDIELATPEVEGFEDDRILETRMAIANLVPPEQRRVIESYYWEGKSYQEIADEMDVPINTVKSWIHRAKAQLREKLS